MPQDISPSILTYLQPLEEAVDEIANTWRPNDPEYRADVYRQIMMQLSYSYFAFFHADAEHPDWAPLWNPVFTLQPNPDDIYLYCPISSDYQYRLTGKRGGRPAARQPGPLPLRRAAPAWRSGALIGWPPSPHIRGLRMARGGLR